MKVLDLLISIAFSSPVLHISVLVFRTETKVQGAKWRRGETLDASPSGYVSKSLKTNRTAVQKRT